jgi:L-Lysine epsilon oxidase N-terminal/L-lysine epsilon oxidase C-terminal domain/Iron-containing redox enzyme
MAATKKRNAGASKAKSGNTYRIHPGVGIARVGDSEEDLFIGPEAPGWRPAPLGGYKDAEGRVRRQAARFRIYEYDAKGTPVREITGLDAEIEWTVRLANKKPSWFRFVGRYKWEKPKNRTLRNPDIEGDARNGMIVDPGPKTVTGLSSPPQQFDGTFQFASTKSTGPDGAVKGEPAYSSPVHLGEVNTDAKGALLVLGGKGLSRSAKPHNPVTHYANNERWHDDVSDGPVTARITLPDGTTVDADPAWVIVAPPKFAPTLDDLVTLDDVVQEVSTSQNWIKADEMVEFHRDILPILRRAANYAWVNETSYRGHGAGAGGNFLEPELLESLMDPSAKSASARKGVFAMLRKPPSLATKKVAEKQASESYMPIIAGDGGEPGEGDPRTWMSLLPGQYERLRKWAGGEFEVGAEIELRPLELLPVAEQPDALDRGALQPCIGGPFYPGIEMTFISAEAETWRAPYRLSNDFEAGDATKWMACPWQADFFECNTHWWPATRPDDVLPEDEYDEILKAWRRHPPVPIPPSAKLAPGETRSPFAAQAAARRPWARGLAKSSPLGDNEMVDYWSEMGFVTPTRVPVNGEEVYVERERLPVVGLDAREIFYKLMNIDQFPEVLPKARALAERALREAREFQDDPDNPLIYRPFEYSAETFQARMLNIYREIVAQAEAYDPATDPLFRTNEDVQERIRQYAPFNLTDGSWLRNITRVGPIDESRAMLFSVLMDEMGDGEASHNHPNIYRDLCHSISFYPSECASEEFTNDPTFVDSAFDLPAFELAISQFSDDFYPEIMGMTLQLELNVIELKGTIALLEYHGFDPHYYKMHVGIDNPVTGHAAKAMRAIILYLDNVRSNGGGEEAVQRQWQRIWDGYVAFGTYGSLGEDVKQRLRDRPTPRERVIEMIERKAHYGSMNHDQHMLGNNYINELFLDPPGFLKALEDSDLFVPGEPEESPFFELTSFETGRMYRVFTEEELELWADWCRSLGQPEPPKPPKRDHYAEMVRVVEMLRNRQTGSAMHHVMTLRKPGTKEEHSVAWWFEQPSRDLVEALAWPDNGWVVPGDPDASLFVTERLSSANPMGEAFESPVPGVVEAGKNGKPADRKDLTARQVAIDWIADGCKFPPPLDGPPQVLWLASSAEVWESHPTRRLLGMAAIH